MMQIIKTFSFFSILLASSSNEKSPSNDNIASSSNERSPSNDEKPPSNDNMASSSNKKPSSNDDIMIKNPKLREILTNENFDCHIDDDLQRKMYENTVALAFLISGVQRDDEVKFIKNFLGDLKAKLELAYNTSNAISKIEGCTSDSNTTPKAVNPSLELDKNELDTTTECDPFVSFVSNYNKDIKSFITDYIDFIRKYVSEKYKTPGNPRNRNNQLVLTIMELFEPIFSIIKQATTKACEESGCNELSDAIYIINGAIAVLFLDRIS